jgi:hypothetical protein
MDETKTVTQAETASKDKGLEESSNSQPNEKDTQEVKKVEPYKSLTFNTEEEYKNFFKSEVSKQKNDWLKAVGATSVDDFKSKEAKYNAAIAESDNLKKQYEETKINLQKALETLMLKNLNVASEHQDDVLTLAKAHQGKDETLEQAAQKILANNAQWLEVSDKHVTIGTEKKDMANTSKDYSNLSKKFPWLKGI